MKVFDDRYQQVFIERLSNYVKYSPMKGFRLRSGARSHLYVDVKSALLDESVGRYIGYRVYDAVLRCAPKGEDAKLSDRHLAVCGYGYGGALLVTTVTSRFSLPGVVIRGDSKQYGLEKSVIGSMPTNSLVVLLEDIVISGSSIREAVALLQPMLATTGSVLCDCIVVVDRTIIASIDIKKLSEDIGISIKSFVDETSLRQYHESKH